MIEFQILKKSKKSNARLGLLKTPHGEIMTPTLVPVATQAVVKTLTSEEVLETKAQILIANTYHLHLRPGEEVVKAGRGLHSFMNWKKPLMTDSGGFQVFSLGFGMDSGTGKILKNTSTREFGIINQHSKPKHVKITEDGVYFRSPIEGKELFLGPKESVRIQEKLGADIIFAFDECTSPLADYEYVKQSLLKTHRWAKQCLEFKRSDQALFGIVQGSRFKDLRKESAAYIDSLDFDGYGIGGDFGEDTRDMLSWITPNLSSAKPRHLLGVGYLKDMESVVASGIDLFDCTVPTHYARRGIAFVSTGKLNLTHSVFLKDRNPLDRKCVCATCQTYTRSYISHLFRADEMTALKLVTFHNLFYFNSFVEDIREKIKTGKI